MDDPTVFPGRASVERRGRAHARVTVPFTGDLALSLRRRASGLLREHAVDGHRIRAVAVTLEPGYLVVSVAGDEDAIDDWIHGGRLARAAAMAVAQAHDDAHRQAGEASRLERLHPARPSSLPGRARFSRRPRES